MLPNLRRLFVQHAIVVAVAFLFLPAAAFSQGSFFQGKTITIIQGRDPGGTGDLRVRALVPFLQKYIPGNPTIVMEYMPGGGSRKAANHLYRTARPDGLTIGNIHGNQILNQVLGGPGVEFDARRFEWVGVPVKDSGACAFTTASGITSLDRWRASKAPVKLGGGGPGDTTTTTAKILKEALGLPIQVVTGYKGTSHMRLAAESGELAGLCFQWESIKTTWRRGLEAGEIVVVMQTNPKRHPELANVPNAIEEAKTEEARQLIRAGLHDPAAMTRPYGLPPGTPRERVEILRKAFLETFKDPGFTAEAKKSNLEVDPVSGEELERLIDGLFKLEPNVLRRLKEVLK